MSNIGFIVLTHANPEQAIKLNKALNSLYDYPPIAWHHDFSKCDLPIEQFSKNVEFVKEYEVTGWGTFSLVAAKMKALNLLYKNNKPDYYIILSGADYPTKSSDEVFEFLKAQGADAFMRSAKIEYGHFDKKWKKRYYIRYCSLSFLFKRKDKKGLEVVSQIPLLKHPLLVSRFTPFNDKYKCWGGEFWYTGSAKCAEFLIEKFADKSNSVINHFKKTKIPDEAIFHTMINNASELNCFHDNRRYVDWSQGLPHPKTLILQDLESIFNSQCHFARKFECNQSKELISSINVKLNINP
ncbi:beta-1,6-N-acetylglucosaminyltransferase [Glaciecola sp. 1036]|uniref:beta-1,6-N-acetylglucosaminyltransferase n=1 Tax=Alteromonadaceae TaxID=72275 RepID=UPI003CFEC645